MKILAVLSALDLKYRYGCTPAWWQLLKGLYENGVEVIATTYQGEAIESPWWRSYPNPCYHEALAFTQLKRLKKSIKSNGTKEDFEDETTKDKAVRRFVQSWIKPRWEQHLKKILVREPGIRAIIIFTVPLNHFSGLPTGIKEYDNIPIFYYDGDVPASLPDFSGFASGFKIYQGADLSEYDAFICNSEGGAQELLNMGARRVETLFWGVDPGFFTPMEILQDYDVAFYGYGAEYRQEWIEKMMTVPSRQMPERFFALGGQGFDQDMGLTHAMGDIPLNVFRNFCCRSKINLNITRHAHASVYASSSARPFELAAMKCCIVSNPYSGLEKWFAPDEEIVIVHDEQQAIEKYNELLEDENKRKKMGAAARKRVLMHHTARQRAEKLINFINSF